VSEGLGVVGKSVIVLGLGVTGRDVARILAQHGATVLASDANDVDAGDLSTFGVEVETGGHAKARDQLSSADFVVPSPGISPFRGILAEAIERRVPIVPELELGIRLANAPVVAVTGTNGKTTVCRLLELMGRSHGLKAYACGNLETKFLTAADEHTDADLFVVEAPSFALTFCETFKPRVAIVTNLAVDHLDWHETLEHYRASKARIAAKQTPDDLFLFPAAQPELESLAPDNGPRREAFSGDGAHETAFVRFRERGGHFADDAAAAAAAARFVGIGDAAIEEALGSFTFDEHRLEPVGSKNGVHVVDDAVSANPHATLAALRAFDRPIVLIAGGRNKGADLDVLAKEASRLRAVVALGEAATELARIFTDAGVPVSSVGSMPEAVTVALQTAETGDVVLLSPACASWDMFNGYADRGRAFRDACRASGVSK
jgi:UDP-N-acetylmuramoylalanine--D-glutamate ligase